MDYFSPAAIVNLSGTVLERYAFSAFGKRRIMTADYASRTNSLYDWEFGFQGQFLDLETWNGSGEQTGLYDYGYRYYVPALGRWPSRDPIGELGGGNLFCATMNNSINAVDLLGLIDNKTPFTGPAGMGMDSFLRDQASRDGNLTNLDFDNIVGSGCIGLCRAYQGTPPPSGPFAPSVMPENQPNTFCYLTEPEAEAACKAECGEGKCFVFAKQGDWRNGQPKKDEKTNRIPNDSVTGKDGVPNRYDYVSKGNDNGTTKYTRAAGPRTFDRNGKPVYPPVYIEPKPPPAGPNEKYPHEMWCYTCCKK